MSPFEMNGQRLCRRRALHFNHEPSFLDRYGDPQGARMRVAQGRCGFVHK
jgi:hypothetical protein